MKSSKIIPSTAGGVAMLGFCSVMGFFGKGVDFGFGMGFKFGFLMSLALSGEDK